MRAIWSKWISLLLLLVSTASWAVDIFHVNNTPLPMAQAYQFSAERHGNIITTQWIMAPGYYLYQNRFCFVLNKQPLTNITLPPARPFQDAVLGNFMGYSDKLIINIPVSGNQPAELQVCYQGCSQEHFCYPPTAREITLPVNTMHPITGKAISMPVVKTPEMTKLSSQDKLGNLLLQKHWWLSFLSFFIMGLLLSATPCVLPMVPILSTLILGQKHINTMRALAISLTYVFAMALTYAVIGIIAAKMGANLQVVLQAPVAIVLLSLLFVILALSLFGFYELRLPHRLTARLTHISNNQKQGSFIGVAVMGILATLIVSPCVSPALIAAVAYIAKTGNMMIGSLALFSMALGMGTPLVLVGLFGGRVLPHAGHWMDVVKQIFGVLLLATSLYLLDRVLPPYISLVLWAALLMVLAVFLGLLQPTVNNWDKFWKGIALLLAVSGALVLYLAATYIPGFSAINTGTYAAIAPPRFSGVNSIAELDNKLAIAATQQKVTMLDFYANWCASCKEMDLLTFNNKSVQQLLQPLQLIRVNMTHNTPDIAALKQRYQVIAPPVVIFIDANGQEIPNTRMVGFINAKEFLKQLSHFPV